MQLSDRIGRRMKLQDLHILMTVVQSGSMRKAAQSLNITQPAISRSVAELEHVFGVRLLERHRQGVETTEYGRALLDCGVAVFDELRQGVKNIEFIADPTTGRVRVGNTLTSASSFVASVVDRISRHHPHIVFHVVPGDADALHRELNERTVDLVICRGGGRFKDEPFNFEILYDDSFVVLTSLQNRWARRRKIELAELINEPWALPPPDNVAGAAAMEAFRASGLDYPRATLFTTSAELRLTLLATGRFFTISASALQFLAKRPELKVLPVKLPMAHLPVGIVTL